MNESGATRLLDQEAINFHRYRSLIFTCCVLFLAWAEIIVFFILLLLNALPGMSCDCEGLLIFDLVAIGVTISIYMLMAQVLRCQSCGKKILVQQLGEKPSSVRSVWGMDAWASTVVNVVKSKRFSCMHCGQEYSI